MNNILRIGTLLRERYTITDLLSNNTGFGITYTIRDANHHQKLSEPKTISLLIEILEVFAYIQNNPGYQIIHRDIKPDNIIRRSSDNKLVIIDFGLAKEVTVTAVLNGDASKAFQNSSCAVKNGSNLTCTVDILKVFNK